MEFSRVIGKIDPKLVKKAEAALSKIFLEFSIRYDNTYVGTFLGGDPLIFSLLFPLEHVCTLNIPTAATDGKRFYWNPKFVLRQSVKSAIGLRIVCCHEAWHAIYMHPQRRGSRNPKLWNIAVDYIVNGTVMDDFKVRKLDAGKTFADHLGRYMTLSQYAEFLKNPFSPPKGFEDLDLHSQDNVDSSVSLPGPNEDRELTPREQKELEKREKAVKFYYADPDLPEEMKRPEKIYDYLYSLLPKCPKCGKVGIYKRPDSGGNGKSCDKHNHDNHQHSSGQSQDKGCDQCGDGGDGIDIFGIGSTIDDHMDTEESEEKLAKRIHDAIETTKRMAGHVPGAIEDELGKLTAPKVRWQDVVRARLLKARAGNGKNDWTKFKTRPMFGGLLIPRKKNFSAHFGCLLDTSGSMSKDDMAFGLSQLCSLDLYSEGTIVPADATIYWDQATKISKIDPNEIAKVKVIGRGGTKYAEFFDDYEKKIGKCDFLIIITDGGLLDSDIAEMRNPGVEVLWLITSATKFKAPFGKVLDLLG